METELTTIRGGCLCGAIRYESTGLPYNVTHCHCEDCRKSAGAAFATWASFRRDNFQFTKGRPREIECARRVRAFCATCGTALTFMSQSDADEVDVTVATSIVPKLLRQPTISGQRIEYRGSSSRTIYHSMHEAELSDLESMRIRALAIGAQSIGAFALGALAIGALALGVVAVGRLVVGRAKIKRVEIDDLVVNRLRVKDSLEIPRA